MPCSAADFLFVTEATVLTNNAILAQIADSMRVHDQWCQWPIIVGPIVNFIYEIMPNGPIGIA